MAKPYKKASLSRRMGKYAWNGPCPRARRIIAEALGEMRKLRSLREEAEIAQAKLIGCCIQTTDDDEIKWRIGSYGGTIWPANRDSYQEAVSRVRQVARLDEVGLVRRITVEKESAR